MGRLRALQRIEHWLYPPVCVLCGGPGSPRLDLCAGCRAELPFNAPACQRCARPMSEAGICGACQSRPPPFDSCIAVLCYADPADWLVRRFKFDGRLSYGKVLSAVLADQIEGSEISRPPILLPVPLHRTRIRERGFNQALEIAQVLAARLELEIDTTVLTRTRATAPQTALESVAQRRRNLRRAFQTNGKVPQHVALVDDVMTTGSTLAECAGTLKRAGCRRVDVWVLARA